MLWYITTIHYSWQFAITFSLPYNVAGEINIFCYFLFRLGNASLDFPKGDPRVLHVSNLEVKLGGIVPDSRLLTLLPQVPKVFI